MKERDVIKLALLRIKSQHFVANYEGGEQLSDSQYIKINMAKETMSSRERVLLTLGFEKPDRVPIDYSANPSIHNRLMKTLRAQNTEEMLELLGVDLRAIDVPYIGPRLFPVIRGYSVNQEYGSISRWVRNEYSGYEDFCCFPLKDATEIKVRNWPMPNPELYDYAVVKRLIRAFQSKAIYIGHPGYPDIINSLGRVMGMESCLINLQIRDEATLDFISRKADFEIGKLERLLNAIRSAGGSADFMMLGEDLGSQIAPLISHELFTDVIRPIFARFIGLAQSYGLPVMVHSCGSSSWVFEDFIQMGIIAVDTLQPEATNMSPAYLKERFGGRLVFHGCISTAALANLSVEGVRNICSETIEIMMPTFGYHFAPTHMIQDNTPVENIIKMYQTIHQLGVYT